MCKNPVPAPARRTVTCIRLVEIDTDVARIGSPKPGVVQDFDIVKRNMDFYYPTITYDGSKALGTNSMIVSFGGSNSTVFPSLFATGQRGFGNLPLIDLKKGGSRNLLPTSDPKEARYGDYFGSAIDPTNSAVRWIAGEYMQAPPAPPIWSTAISRITILPPLITSASIGNGNGTSSATTFAAPAGGVSCSDGTAPDVTTGLCADGNPPPPAANLTQAPAATNEPGQVCADGSFPDPTTGLCADGSQPQSQTLNATAADLATPTTCLR